MSRVGGDGDGGVEDEQASSGIGQRFGGAAHLMIGNKNSSYVVLGGTKYGIRLSQEMKHQSRLTGNLLDCRQKGCCREKNFREQSTQINDGKTSMDNVTIDLVSNMTDCCCIGTRSRLPPPQISQSSTMNSRSSFVGATSNLNRSIGNIADIHAKWNEAKGGGQRGEEGEGGSVSRGGGQCSLPPTKIESNSNANNNCGGLQIGSHITQQPQSFSASSSTVDTGNVVFGASSFAPVVHTVSVSRQIAQWTKHQTSKLQSSPAIKIALQEQTTTEVDRLPKFRWSGGGGGGCKKSSSGPRSDKAERLRELTEKLKSPAPIPPPRRPSRLPISSPPPPPLPPPLPSELNQHYNQYNNNTVSNQVQDNRTNIGHNKSTHNICNAIDECSNSSIADRHYFQQYNRTNSMIRVHSESTYSECRENDHLITNNNDDKIDNNFDSLSEELLRMDNKPVLVVDETNYDNNGVAKRSSSDTYSETKHFRQYSDSILNDTSKCINDHYNSTNLTNEARDAVARLEQRRSTLNLHRTGVPFRSASFGQVDFIRGNRHRTQPINSNCLESKDVRACTLPRRRSDSTATTTSTITTTAKTTLTSGSTNINVFASQNNPKLSQSPRTSTPSVDSAVGSVEGLGVTQIALEQSRPRSDGSDSLTTSSALNSPEPLSAIDNQESQINLVSDITGTTISTLENNICRIANTKVNEAESRENQIELHEVIITPPPEEPRLSKTSEVSKVPSETLSSELVSATPSGKIRRYRGDTSKRRKGVYITQWPEPSENDRNKLSAQSSEEKDDPPTNLSDVSDCEGHVPRRYSKRPLRGPYGQMLEAEMAKPRTTDIALDESLRLKRKVSANLSYNPGSNNNSDLSTSCHHRTTSSPSKLESLSGPSPELLAELLRGSSERVARVPVQRNKYFQPLKSPENSGLVESTTVDEIFYQIPAILSHHEIFLEELRKRLETWELHQTIGDVFLDVFTKPVVLEAYTLFLDNWKSAKKAIKICQGKPAFARFLETMEREHKGKLGLDQLLIKPVQKIPRYELLIQRLLENTDATHPDYDLLTVAQREVHELVVKINCTERESLEWEQQQTTLKEVQSLVEGLAGIVANDRSFIRHDLVTIATNQGTRKERALFLFSDLLVITSIKRRSGTIRKPSTSSCPNSLVGLLEANKYKLLMRISLDDLEVMKAKDENLKKMAREVDHLREDCSTLCQLQELAATLHGTKHHLEDFIKDLLTQTQRQLAERNAAHSQLACLELTFNTTSGIENISVMFAKPDKRANWEESFNEAKHKLALSADKRPCPEFIGPLPIQKTRAGLQFTCAAPTIINGQGPRDVWVCNSDGYVGQVCVLNLNPEPPQVTSCNGVCNARILCVAGIPAVLSGTKLSTTKNNAFDISKSEVDNLDQETAIGGGNIQLDSSSSDDSDSDNIPCADTMSGGLPCGELSSIDGVAEEDINQSTMWLGTEDGCIHVYNCTDNIRIKKNKVNIQHGSSVYSIIYLDNKVFVALANGDISVYVREHGGWNTADPSIISVGTVASPVTKMVPVSGNLWCSCQNTVKVINTITLEIEHTLNISGDSAHPVSCMAASGGIAIWISLHNSAVLRLFHANTYECLTEINIAPAITKMLASCDDIIRQHKAACLRVTALLSCNDLLWIGTSAGVLLTVPIPHIKSSTQRLPQPPPVSGIPHGHTGHVRFLTCVETPVITKPNSDPNRLSLKTGKNQQNDMNRMKLLVISGGDGYEDFRGPQASAELQAGRDDSTNHLLLWKV
ncbi:hypothetical protein PV327_008520 [Microctonus hyperodae]|uniref:DH domain-containing protein n=1 Tax=Microctonus hyperodae TaxID=165561 RepID=A0AA39KHF6_MICHY|nr:hypothetical protein PV327_008520 [Microctonus hyperodae]